MLCSTRSGEENHCMAIVCSVKIRRNKKFPACQHCKWFLFEFKSAKKTILKCLFCQINFVKTAWLPFNKYCSPYMPSYGKNSSYQQKGSKMSTSTCSFEEITFFGQNLYVAVRQKIANHHLTDVHIKHLHCYHKSI